MKICAIICEYNPFHNGHLYQLEQARASGADAVLCIMSGNFVQRGEAAVMDKYTRAKHAVMAGADIVIELPTVFATSNAEIFAKGAIKLLSSIPAVTSLCFGAETDDAEAFLSAAKQLNNEPAEISGKIKQNLSVGMSFAKARAEAWSQLIPQELLSSPNNILGLEYAKAIVAYNANIRLLPILRIGSGYNTMELKENYSSASAIRQAIKNKEKTGSNLPDYVKNDLPNELENKLVVLEKYAVISKNATNLTKVCDCNEGLENAFKNATLSPLSFPESLTSARYTASRIRRIALQNLLNIEENFIRECLCSSLYLHVLATKKSRKDVLTALSESSLPLLVRAHDEDVLTDTAKACHAKDIFAEAVYSLLYPNNRIKKTIFV